MFNLDKVTLGEKITIQWQGKNYTYEVHNIFTASPKDGYVEDNSEQAMLTLYSCTPLYTSESRLVVQAKLIEVK